MCGTGKRSLPVLGQDYCQPTKQSADRQSETQPFDFQLHDRFLQPASRTATSHSRRPIDPLGGAAL